MPPDTVGKVFACIDCLRKAHVACGEWQSLQVAWVEELTGNNEDPGEPGGQLLLHFIMEVAREGCLQLSDGGNQERYPQDGNSAAELSYVNVSECSTKQHAQR